MFGVLYTCRDWKAPQLLTFVFKTRQEAQEKLTEYKRIDPTVKGRVIEFE